MINGIMLVIYISDGDRYGHRKKQCGSENNICGAVTAESRRPLSETGGIEPLRKEQASAPLSTTNTCESGRSVRTRATQIWARGRRTQTAVQCERQSTSSRDDGPTQGVTAAHDQL